MYYLRTKPAAAAIQFTVDKTALKLKQAADAEAAAEGGAEGDKDAGGVAAEAPEEDKKVEENLAGLVCSIQNREDCLMCGS